MSEAHLTEARFRAAAVPQDNTPPTEPGSFAAAAGGDTEIDLTWTASTDPDDAVAGYVLLRDGGAISTLGPAATAYADAGLAPCTGHSYALIAFDTAGNQSARASASATTTGCPPPPPPPPSVWHVLVAVDGVTIIDVDSTLDASVPLDHFLFGAQASGDVNDYTEDDLLVGTTGVGSSDFFSDDFSGATIAPPFDSVVGSGISLSGGKLLLQSNPAVDGYAVKSLLGIGAAAYFRFTLNLDPSMDDGQSTADFIDIWYGGDLLLGLFVETVFEQYEVYGQAAGIGRAVTYGVDHVIDIVLTHP